MLHRIAKTVIGLLAVGAAALPAVADVIVVPNHAPNTAGTGGYSTLLRSAPRSYQLVVGPEELTGMPAGSSITGITWRRPTWQVFPDWPGTGVTCSWSNYDISLSISLNPPGSLSRTYTENIGPDVVLVRSGPIQMSGAFFPGGALSPAVNPFGTVIPFSAPYEYQGGNLLLTIRHDGNDCGGNGSLDTVPSQYAQAIGVSSYTEPSNWYNQGLIVMQLTFEPPAACPADVNGDLVVNVLDLLAVLSAWGQSGVPEDINGDGIVDVLDLLELLAAWGPCP